MIIRRSAQFLCVTALAAAGCDDPPPDAADRMRAAYAPTQSVTVGGFAWEIATAIRSDVIYGVGLHRLVQIDRATGVVTDLVAEPAASSLSSIIAADDTHVYVELQRTGIVRIARGGGEPETILPAGDLSVSAMQAHGGALYVEGYRWDLERTVLTKVPLDGGPAAVIAELAPQALSAFAVTSDGVFLGNANTGGSVSRVPLAGGPPEVIQATPETPYHIVGNGTGIYWNLAISDPAPTTPARLFTLAPGSTEPQELAATAMRGSFAVNDLGFYWVDYDGRRIFAMSREDLAGEPFDIFATGDAPLDVAADDGALVYTTNDDDDDLGDLELHVVPRVD